MSMGFFLDDSSPVIWRGPLVTGLLRQFLKDVEWGELDVLVVDLPPGTGDAQLTLVQQVPLVGRRHRHHAAGRCRCIDVERGIAMFNQVNTPVLGMVENMSAYVCPHCGTRDELFGSGGGDASGAPVRHSAARPDSDRAGRSAPAAMPARRSSSRSPSIR